jgi:hypothetical protein
LKELIGNSEFDGAVVIRSILKKLDVSFDYLNDGVTKRNSPHVRLDNISKSEFSSHAGELYHGTSFSGAASILKSKTFSKGSAYDRLSLSSDITSAMKFGDTVFVFDAKKLQRKRAKKIRYFSNDQLESYYKYNGKYPSEDDLSGAIISDIYKSEKEWYVPLPFSFEDEDLIKIILINTGNFNCDSAKEKLESITVKPIQIISYIPTGHNKSVATSENYEINAAESKFQIYNIFQLNHLFETESKKYIKNLKKDYMNRLNCDESEATMYVKNTKEYWFINNIHRELEKIRNNKEIRHQSDADDIINAIDAIKYIYENYADAFNGSDGGLNTIQSIIKNILNLRSQLVLTLESQFFSSQDKLEELIRSYLKGGGMSNFGRKSIFSWMEKNPTKIREILDTNYNSTDSHESVEFRKENIIRSFLERTEKIDSVENDILRKFPISVIDNPKFEHLNDGKLRDIFEKNSNININTIMNRIDYASGRKLDMLHSIEHMFYENNPDKKPKYDYKDLRDISLFIGNLNDQFKNKSISKSKLESLLDSRTESIIHAILMRQWSFQKNENEPIIPLIVESIEDNIDHLDLSQFFSEEDSHGKINIHYFNGIDPSPSKKEALLSVLKDFFFMPKI